MNTECDAWWQVARATVGSVAAASFRIRVIGAEHIPRHGGALLAYNHVSVLDAIFVGLPVTRRGRIVRCFALSEDFERPFMGRALRGLGQIPIRRGAGAWDPLEKMADVIRRGWLGGIAPEGTVGTGRAPAPHPERTSPDRAAAGCPVIPIGIWGAQRRYRKEGIHFGAPLWATLGCGLRSADLPAGRPEMPAGRAGAHRPAR